MFDITTFLLTKDYTTAIVSKQAGKTVDIESASGELDEDALKSLLESVQSTVVLENKVYRLSRIEGNTYKYINTKTDGTKQTIDMTELDINKITGKFTTKQLVIEGSSVAELWEIVDNHINDSSVHISDADRAAWNNKVSADATQIGTSNNYNLNLSKE